MDRGASGTAGRGGTTGTAGTRQRGPTGTAGTTGLGEPGSRGIATFQPLAAAVAVRKVKNLLTGMTPTDDEIAAVTAQGTQGLQTLIDGWMTDPTTAADCSPRRWSTFFRNYFQQTGFSAGRGLQAAAAHQRRLRLRADRRAVGDDAFYRLVQNIQDSFALTAWQMVADGRPFNGGADHDRAS